MKKILIAEDNIAHLLILKKTLTLNGYEVLTSRNGKEAMEILRHTPVDFVLTDWMMPEMDGLELIRRIRDSVRPSPRIIVLTVFVSDDALWKAISTGADEVLTKPYDTKKIVAAIERLSDQREHSIVAPPTPSRAFRHGRPPFIAIAVAASTGGPDTLTRFFTALPALPDAAVFVVLHGPAWLLKTMVGNFQKHTEMTVRLAEDGLQTRAGEIYLAPGERHTTVEEESLVLRLNDDPPENFVKPAADPLFKSVAIAFGRYSIGVVMTGMGHDGTIGCGYISAAGGIVIVQDPLTAVIASMPKTVASLGLANEISTITAMPDVIKKYIKLLKNR